MGTPGHPVLDAGRVIGEIFAVASSVSFIALTQMLGRLDAKLEAHQVHALFLGAVTSPSLSLGPQHLLGAIFGDDSRVGDSPASTQENLQTLFGYWNTLLDARERGRVRLASMKLRASPGSEDLIAYARRRRDEVRWFVRGFGAGGEPPDALGEEGMNILQGIAEGDAYMLAYADVLERTPSSSQTDLEKSREMLMQLTGTIESLIADLMDASDALRRDAMDVLRAHAEREPAATAAKVGRNDACPCGSGKKWKRCCGAARTLQ